MLLEISQAVRTRFDYKWGNAIKMLLEISDNAKKQFSGFPQASDSDLKNISSIANKKIDELVSEKNNLLIFLQDLNSANDKIGDEKIFTLENSDN